MKTSSEPSEPQVETEDAVSNGEKPVAAKAADKGLKASMSSQIEDLVATVRRLEAFAAVEARRVSDKVIPQVETRARQNIWVSLLMALGLGIIVGIWLTGGRRRD